MGVVLLSRDVECTAVENAKVAIIPQKSSLHRSINPVYPRIPFLELEIDERLHNIVSELRDNL